MTKIATFLVSVSTTILVLVIGIVSAEEFTLPKLNAGVALQVETFRGGDSTYVSAMSGAAVNAPSGKQGQ